MKIRDLLLGFAFIVAFHSFIALGSDPVQINKCASTISSKDIVAVDHNANGDVIEYKRNRADVSKLLISLKAKIERDPAITQSKDWNPQMLTEEYWLVAVCGGTKNCSSKSCPSGSCSYSNIGMAGCRC